MNEFDRSAVNPRELLPAIEEALVAFSRGEIVTAPVGFLGVGRGDVHIKSGYRIGSDYYVVKIASAFPTNPSDGIVLLFHQNSGKVAAIFNDEGYITDLRTGLVGAICAKWLASPQVEAIGICGTGTQARQQLNCLRLVTPCRRAFVWGRNRDKAEAFCEEFADFEISPIPTTAELARCCDLIVTTTPAHAPILSLSEIRPGTHITAVGSDQVGKQELDPSILARADAVVVDSLVQCTAYGELSHMPVPAVELGQWIAEKRRRDPRWITVADLTGVAAADLAVAESYLQ